MIRQVSARQLAQMRADGEAPVVLDVREPWEVAICRLADSLTIPMREVPARLAELDPSAPVVCLCHHGARSLQVAMFLARNGFASVMNLDGGIDAWSREVDATVATY